MIFGVPKVHTMTKRAHFVVLSRRRLDRRRRAIAAAIVDEQNFGRDPVERDGTQRSLDERTPLDTGPALLRLPAESSATVSFSGYGVALLEFVARGAGSS